MSLNASYPSAFPAIATPIHYPLPNPYLYRRPIIQGKDDQRPITAASSSSVSVNSSGNSSPAPSLASVASSEVSSPPPQSPHTFNERPPTDYYSMIAKQPFNPATPITATATATPAVPSYPATSYPSIDFPSAYGYDFYSNPATTTPKIQSLPAIPPLPAMPIQSMNTDPSAIYAAREFPTYDPMMAAAAYDPSTFAYARNRLFDPRLYPAAMHAARGYGMTEEEWYGDAKGKKRAADKKRGRGDDEEALRKRARALQRSTAAAASVNPTNRQRSVIHCGIPRAYLEKKTNGETVEVNDDDRVFFLYSPFFGKELDVYYADDDPFHRPLFRASALHKKFGCATNKMDMYLCRKKAKEGPKCGIFQCLCFDGRREEHGLFGLKAGTYFVSEDACAAFADHAKEQRFRKKRTAKAKREKERRENGQMDPIDDLSSDDEEDVPRNPPASNDRGVEMMVHMIQMFSKSNDNNASKPLENKNESNHLSTSTAAIVPPAAIAVSNPSA